MLCINNYYKRVLTGDIDSRGKPNPIPIYSRRNLNGIRPRAPGLAPKLSWWGLKIDASIRLTPFTEQDSAVGC